MCVRDSSGACPLRSATIGGAVQPIRRDNRIGVKGYQAEMGRPLQGLPPASPCCHLLLDSVLGQENPFCDGVAKAQGLVWLSANYPDNCRLTAHVLKPAYPLA